MMRKSTNTRLPDVRCVDWTELSRILCILLLIANLGEGMYGIAQLVGWLGSGHPGFRVTGSFYNPGPFACYLAMTLPIAVRYCLSPPRKYLKWLAGAVVAADVMLLPGLMSRTAWIAATLGSIVALAHEISDRIQDLTHRNTPAKAIMVAIVVGAVLIGSIGMYHMKQDSADGRLLMWKVGITAVSPSPFSGCGLERIAGEYGDAQERYFASGKASGQEIKVADAPEYLFNEYLGAAVAFGWGWSIVMIGVLIAAFLIAWSNLHPGLAGSIVAVSIVMGTSYPFQFPISVISIGVVILASFLTSTLIEVKAIGFAACLILCLAFVRPDRRYEFRSLFSSAHILHRAGKYQKSNDMMFRLLPYTSDPMPLVIIGKNYRNLNRPDSAEHYFRRASYRCPNRFYPHYLLMQLYLDSVSPDHEKARIEAETILSQEVKIPSPAITEMREEAQSVISAQKPHYP